MSAVATALVLILAVDASAPAGACEGWRHAFVEQLASLRSKYPVLAEFDPKLHAYDLDDPTTWRIAFDHHSERRLDVIQGAKRSYRKERHVLRGVDALNIDIEFFSDEIIGDLQHLHIFDGHRCGYRYEVNVQGADAAMASQLRTDILHALNGRTMPGGSPASKSESEPSSSGKRNAFTCGVKGSSVESRWRWAVDGNRRTGWCPSASDEERTFTASFCEPVIVSQIRVVTDRGVLKFAPSSHGTEIRLDHLVIPLAPVESNSEERAALLPAQGQQVQQVAVRLAKPGAGGDRCLLDLVVEERAAAPATGTVDR